MTRIWGNGEVRPDRNSNVLISYSYLFGKCKDILVTETYEAVKQTVKHSTCGICFSSDCECETNIMVVTFPVESEDALSIYKEQ